MNTVPQVWGPIGLSRPARAAPPDVLCARRHGGRSRCPFGPTRTGPEQRSPMARSERPGRTRGEGHGDHFASLCAGP